MNLIVGVLTPCGSSTLHLFGVRYLEGSSKGLHHELLVLALLPDPSDLAQRIAREIQFDYVSIGCENRFQSML